MLKIMNLSSNATTTITPTIIAASSTVNTATAATGASITKALNILVLFLR